MYNFLVFEISGSCNGKCKWCSTGNQNRKGAFSERLCIKYEKFVEAIEYLLDNHLISNNTDIHIYNWGEPFLNKDIKKIIKYLSFRNLNFIISTNATKYLEFNYEEIKNLKEIKFSMAGFSQESYNKIHGFDFNNIKNNIIKISKNIKENNSNTKITISYHVYQFNLKEYKDVLAFSNKQKINIVSYYAYFNSYEMYKNYLSSKMPYEQLKDASQQLFLYYIENELINYNNDYECVLKNEFLTLDEKCNILTCCVLDKESKNYSIGNLFKIPIDQFDSLKKNQEICNECDRLGISYLIQKALDNKWQLFYNKKHGISF